MGEGGGEGKGRRGRGRNKRGLGGYPILPFSKSGQLISA